MQAISALPPLAGPAGSPPCPGLEHDALGWLAAAHDGLRLRLAALVLPAGPLGVALSPARRDLVEAALALKIHARLARDLVCPSARLAAPSDPVPDSMELGLAQLEDCLEAALALPAGDPCLAERIAQLQRRADRQFADEEVALFSRLAGDAVDLEALGLRLAARHEEILRELGMGEPSSAD